MDSKLNSELNESLKMWRARLSDLAPEDLAELEGHLFDSMEELRQSGLSEQEAFEVAMARLGSPGELAVELGATRVTPHPNPEFAVAGGRFGIGRVLSVLLLSVGAAAVVAAGWAGWLALQPVVYTGRVLIELPPPVTIVVPGAVGDEEGSIKPLATIKGRVEEESELIRSTLVLEKVVERFGLTNRWKLAGPDQAVARLRSMVTLSAEPGTSLVKLELRHIDAKETPLLANAVAEAYLVHGSEQWEQNWAELEMRMIKDLEGKVGAVESSRQELLQVVQRTGVTDMTPFSGGDVEATQVPKAGQREVFSAKLAYQRAQADLDQAKITMNQLATSERRGTIHEFATEPVVPKASKSQFEMVLASVLAVLGLISMMVGWRVRLRSTSATNA